VLKLTDPRAGHNGHNRSSVIGHPKGCAGSLAIGRLRNEIGNWMTNISRLYTSAVIDIGLKRKNTQHVIDRLLNLTNTLWPPGPDRWANEVYGSHTPAPQLSLDPKVKVRRINTKKYTGLPFISVL
jgi:hypothetical protein